MVRASGVGWGGVGGKDGRGKVKVVVEEFK